MALYIFERSIGNLSENKVKQIIRKAGLNTKKPNDYNPGDYEYEESSTKEVHACGPGTMKVNTLEKAAKDLKIGGVTVSHLDDALDILDNSLAGISRSADNPLGATNYGVRIVMSQETVEKLSNGNYSLFGFKAVQTKVSGGAPLVWFKSNDFGLSTDVSWEIQYEAYTSRTSIVPNGRITGLNSYSANLGQRLEVDKPQGTGSVKTGTPGNISVENLTNTEMTCGISEVVEGKSEPLCAFPLYGNGLDAMVPIQKVMFTFSTETVDTGTVIEKAYSQSILIDLTSATNREVFYDINDGWDWGGFNWGQSIRPSQNVGPILIEDVTSFAKNAVTMLG
ncbi:MAG: hypothetical protein OEX11_04095 [Nitrosomonas sp.]|nr:hypothetical protein [Nitrosomonas sp.]